MEWIIFFALFGGFLVWAAKHNFDKPSQGYGSYTPPYKPNVAETAATKPTIDQSRKYLFEPSDGVYQLIKALLYVGKADGQLREDEVGIIIDFLYQQQPEHRDSDLQYLAIKIRETKPFSTTEYNSCINSLGKDNLVGFIWWCKKITGTQKKNHPFEDHLLAELQTLLASKS
jgi:hypothetical protein